MADGTQPLQGTAPYTFGLTIDELIDQIVKELGEVQSAVDAADSLTNVSGLALRQQDCDADADIADVLQGHVYPHLSTARDGLQTADELIARLRQLTAKEVSHD